jgi:hypothetical protein
MIQSPKAAKMTRIRVKEPIEVLKTEMDEQHQKAQSISLQTIFFGSIRLL